MPKGVLSIIDDFQKNLLLMLEDEGFSVFNTRSINNHDTSKDHTTVTITKIII